MYDGVRNILVKHQEGSNPITMVYDAANRIETSQQGAVVTTYTSDANGNLTAQNAGGSKTTFTYDNENRLKTIQHADATLSSYTYAGGFPVQGEGLRRTRHQPGGSLTTTIWDGSDYLMEKGGGSTARYVVSEGEMLAEKRSGARLAFVPDPLGSVIGLLNSSQAFTDTFAFWPYGEVRARTGSTPTPFRWVGTLGYYEDLDWLYYIRARYELGVLGRWLTKDPISALEVWHYVDGLPTVDVDPAGLTSTRGGGSLRLWGHTPPVPCDPTALAGCTARCKGLGVKSCEMIVSWVLGWRRFDVFCECLPEYVDPERTRDLNPACLFRCTVPTPRFRTGKGQSAWCDACGGACVALCLGLSPGFLPSNNCLMECSKRRRSCLAGTRYAF